MVAQIKKQITRLTLLLFVPATLTLSAGNCNKTFPTEDFWSLPLLLLPTSPGVSNLYPGDGLTNIKVNESLLVVFDKAMDSSSLTMQSTAGSCGDTIQLSGDDFVTCLAGTVVGAGDNQTFGISATNRMMENTTYKLKITTGAKSSDGGSLAADWTHSTGFTTFNPLSVTGAILWVRADSPAGVLNASGLPASQGEQVATWTDESGTGNTAAQATAGFRPTLQTGIMDGKPVLRFDGTNDFLIIPGNVTNGLSGVTIFLALHSTGTVLNQNDVIFGSLVTGPDAFLMRFDTTGVARFLLGVNTIGINQSISLTNRSGTAESFVLMGRAASSAAAIPGVITDDNGISGALVNVNWLGNTIRSVNPKYIGAGFFGGGPLLPYPGDIAEIIIFNRALSPGESKTISCHLKNKYSTTFGTSC